MLRSHFYADGLIALLLALPLAGAVGAAAPPDDAWLTLKVKLGLATSNIAARGVSVDTIDGVVALHGSVPSNAERSEAEGLAKRIPGVREVRNLLRPEAPAEPQLAVSSERIMTNVIAALKAEPALAESQIAVPSVTSGVVLLAGRARSLSEAYCAVRAASRVEGVKRVASQIESPELLGESQLRLANAGSAPGARRSVANDLLTTSEVKLRLLANVETAHYDIYVDTDDATVTLFGSVASEGVHQQAMQQARGVAGVHQLVNDLVVTGVRPSPRRSDAEIAHLLAERFAARASLADSRIDIEVNRAVARLTGKTHSRSDRITALTVARTTDGVVRVIDRLELDGPAVSTR